MSKPSNTVSLNELTLSNDGYGNLTHQGRLFNGMAYDVDPNTGLVTSLGGHWLGSLHGPDREWFANGQLASEEYYRLGAWHGPAREWDEAGRLRFFAYRCHGVSLWQKRWDEAGRLISEVELDPKSERSVKVKNDMERSGGDIVDFDVRIWEFVERPWGWGQDLADLGPPSRPPRLPGNP